MSGVQAVPRECSRGEITRNLLAWSAGDGHAAAPALSALYATLHQLARRALSAERVDHTLGTAGLISEAYLRLLEQRHIGWRSREHFIAIAAQMMRRILVDYARGRRTAKRGRDAPALPLTEAVLAPAESLDELAAIHDALEALAAIDGAQSKLVELRFFGGMTHEEIASYFGISLATVERRWRLARAWLYRHLKQAGA
jgi:RNA polymerase sigma factor (TIGR02999 family)